MEEQEQPAPFFGACLFQFPPGDAGEEEVEENRSEQGETPDFF